MAFDPARPINAAFATFGQTAVFRLASGEQAAVRVILRRPDATLDTFASSITIPTRQVEVLNAQIAALPRAPQAGDIVVLDGTSHDVINTPERRDPLALVWTLDLR